MEAFNRHLAFVVLRLRAKPRAATSINKPSENVPKKYTHPAMPMRVGTSDTANKTSEKPMVRRTVRVPLGSIEGSILNPAAPPSSGKTHAMQKTRQHTT